jgi:hypothetical protein
VFIPGWTYRHRQELKIAALESENISKNLEGVCDRFHPVSATYVSGLECANIFGCLICNGEALDYAIVVSWIYHASSVIMANL